MDMDTSFFISNEPTTDCISFFKSSNISLFSTIFWFKIYDDGEYNLCKFVFKLSSLLMIGSENFGIKLIENNFEPNFKGSDVNGSQKFCEISNEDFVQKGDIPFF